MEADSGTAEAVESGPCRYLLRDRQTSFSSPHGTMAEIPDSASRIIPINIEDEMKSSYIDYSMSVIVSRALPDVRDGLKPVQRRVLYGMQELGLAAGRAHKKSARIVGEVLGKYHPHGDQSVYDALVRMAQDFAVRGPLVDGQGNFGSVDGDSAAAMRYTEARLTRLAEELLRDLDKETVDYTPNFDGSLNEPTVLPAALPNLLLNGASGIAVGMATNIPPHNLGELVDGVVAYIEDPEIELEALMEHIPAPDFPTGGVIFGVGGVREAYRSGRGRVVMRAKMHEEEIKRRGGDGVGPRCAGGDRDPVPGQQVDADREDRARGARQEDRGHRRPARRVRPRRHADRDGVAPRRRPRGHEEPALQVHPAPADLRR